jgi:hypothetical protein
MPIYLTGLTQRFVRDIIAFHNLLADIIYNSDFPCIAPNERSG